MDKWSDLWGIWNLNIEEQTRTLVYCALETPLISKQLTYATRSNSVWFILCLGARRLLFVVYWYSPHIIFAQNLMCSPPASSVFTQTWSMSDSFALDCNFQLSATFIYVVDGSYFQEIIYALILGCSIFHMCSKITLLWIIYSWYHWLLWINMHKNM